MALHILEKLHRLHDGYLKPVSVGGHNLLLLQVEGRVHLIANSCPHLQAPLTHASIEGSTIRCPAHGIEFDLISGCPLKGQAGKLKKYSLAYQGSNIGVEL
ncbi:Rieske (2Fe-2S) protein [Aurantivibrio infirmus]